MSGVDIEGVLAGHRFGFEAIRLNRDDAGKVTGYTLGCSCGKFCYSPGPEAESVMEAHVAAVLRERIAAAQAEALDIAADNMPLSRPGQPYEHAAGWLRRRAALAAQIAPSRDGLSAGGGDGS